MTALLTCENLDVRFRTEDGEVCAVSNLSLQLNAGDCLGVERGFPPPPGWSGFAS